MEEKPSVGIAMVSRLPKFGGRSSTGGASSLPNGSPQSTIPSQDTKTTTTATPPNGLVRKPSFSLKWRREACSTPSTPLPPTTSTSPEEVKPQEVKPQTPLLLGKEVKNATPGTPKLRRSGSSLLSVSSPKAIPKQTSKAPSTKLAQSPLRPPKTNQNGSNSPIRPRPMSGCDSRLALPKGPSSLHFSGSQDSLSLSSDSLKNMSMDNMVRSHSFTHFKQVPSPTSQPMTRSFSFNRAVELAKPLANTNLRPPQASFLKPPQLSNARVGLGGSLGGLGGGLQYSRASSAATSVSSLSSNTPSTPTTPTALKKPLLPSCMTTKPLGGSIGGYLGYKLARPGHTKLQKPLFMGRVKGDARPVTAPGCGRKSGKDAEDQDTGEINKADLHSGGDYNSVGRGGGGGGRLSYATVAGEALEDMSLSSASSLERGDTSEEFLEDVDSGADTFSDGDPADTKTGSSAQQRLRNFLNETMDWSNIDAAGGKEDVALQDSKCSRGAVSPEQGDLLQGSSLELSPSNSSGGTYMWDEEGLEPLGGAGMHRCDSYDDSELNSMAILNHLEPLSIEDLDDDDLMLELDLPKDVLLHHDSDRMSAGGRSERAGRQGRWRHKQHRWNGPEHFHNDNRGPVFQHYDGPRAQGSIRGQPQPQQPASQEDDSTMGATLPDELTLKHMAQDYSSLKNQLLKLQTILQFEDADAAAAVEQGEVNPTALQFEALMQEVQVLRGELSSRDQTIAQLTLRSQQLQHLQQQQQRHNPTQGLPGRCHCQHQRPPSNLRQVDRRHHDKATQTHLRTHSQTPPVPQPSSLCPSQHLHLERLAKPPTAAPSDSWEQEEEARSVGGRETASASPMAGDDLRRADRSTPDDDELSLLLGTRLHLLDDSGAGTPRGGGARGSPPRLAAPSGPAPERRPPAETPACSGPRPVSSPFPSFCLSSSACPPMLQPPRLHKRVSVPVLPPGAGSQRLPANPGAGLLPPPSRGLPCFDAGLPAQVQRMEQPQTTVRLLRGPGCGDGAPHPGPAPGQLRYPGASKVLLPSSHKRLPRPKVHYGAHQT
ncbi:unnamed protein product [Lota lota]